MAAPGATPPAAPPMPKMTGMLITLVLVIVLMMFNEPIAKGMNYVLGPTIAFYDDPVITLVIAGLLMTFLSTVIRSLMIDTVKQQRNQKEMQAFQKELRQARIENNLYKIKKLSDQQSAMMAKSMEGTSSMMKTMPITMLIVIPVFAWVRYFIDNLPSTIINIPWGTVNLTDSMLLPMWIFVYMLITIPFGQLVNRLVRTFLFRKRLKELESGTEIEVV